MVGVIRKPVDPAKVAAALERALRNAAEAKDFVSDAVVIQEVLRRWYGDAAELVLVAALELERATK